MQNCLNCRSENKDNATHYVNCGSPLDADEYIKFYSRASKKNEKTSRHLRTSSMTFSLK